MTSPDTTLDTPVVGGQLGRLNGVLESPPPSGPAPGRTGLDGATKTANGHVTNVQDSGKGLVSDSLSGTRDIADGDAKSANNFAKAGTESGGGGGRGAGPGISGTSNGLAGAGGSPLGAFKSNMPVPGGAGSPMSQLMGLTQPVQSALSSAQSVPQQLLSPLTSILGGGGGMPGSSGLSGSSTSPMGAVGPLGDSRGGGSGDIKSRLDQFVAKTAGVVDYSWGGGHGQVGPSLGVHDGGGAADAHGDYAKTGVDCSGYSRWALAEVAGSDVLGSSTSQSQYSGGTAVSAPRAADLAFPPSAFSGSEGPHHVQVYLGDGMVAEAPQSGEKVRVRPVTPGTVFRRYLSEDA